MSEHDYSVENEVINVCGHNRHKKHLLNLIHRDEPKQVVREHNLRAWGTCPVCKTSVGLPFHIKFCGACGTRLVWEGEKK